MSGPHTRDSAAERQDDQRISRTEEGLSDSGGDDSQKDGTVDGSERTHDTPFLARSDGDKMRSSSSHPVVVTKLPSNKKSIKDKNSDDLDGLSSGQDTEQGSLLRHSIEQGDEGDKLLPEDSYSYLAIARSEHERWYRPDRSIVMAFGIFLFQILTFTLLAIDIVDIENENPLDIPAGVDIQVRISQLIALIITVISQDEVRLSLNVLYNGYDQDALTREFGGASRLKWYLSVICRFLSGCFGLAVTFMLLITAETVRDLLLNFTAVEFVSSVDDTVFLLSKWGYFGRRMTTDSVTIEMARETPDEAVKRTRTFPRTACLIVLFLAMVAAWLVVAIRQERGAYLCPTMYVQFGDEFDSSLGAFSGLYQAVNNRKLGVFRGGRVEYIARTSGDYDGSARFIYCDKDSAWTFVHGNTPAETLHPCDRSTIRAQSSESFSFDVVETATSTWYVRDYKTSRAVPMQHFSMVCHTTYVGKGKCHDGECGDRFQCKNNTCICEDGRYGVGCQFTSPCKEVVANERFEGFADARSWSSSFTAALGEANDTAVQVYGRPLYIGNKMQAIAGSQHEYDLMIFTGRRWVLTHTGDFQDLWDQSDLRIGNHSKDHQSIIDKVTMDFHAYWSNYTVSFLSEPVDVDTPLDGPTPVSLKWFHANSAQLLYGKRHPQAPDFNREIGKRLLCALCNVTDNPCFFDGECQGNGTYCDCTNSGATGTLCQIPPLGNGFCNPVFNEPGYSYDEGDCCESTCNSSGAFLCGKDDSGFVDVGFPFCQERQAGKLYPSGQRIQGSAYSRTGYSVSMSGNGAILAVGEPGTNSVEIFDRDGATWRTRGLPLTGVSGFGQSVATSRGLTNIVNNPKTLAPIRLAVAGSSDNTTQVYDCASRGCLQVGNSIPSHGAVVGLSDSGRVVAVGSRGGNGVDVYGQTAWTLLGGTIGFVEPSVEYPTWDAFGFTLSISGNGNVVAVGEVAVYENYEADGYVMFEGAVSVNAYSWNGTSWQRREIPIRRRTFDWSYEVLKPNYRNVFFKESLALSRDGSILAIGTLWNYEKNPRVHTFSWNGTSWLPHGKVDSSLTGFSVALSGDGATLAVGPGPDESESAPRLFRWNETGWKTTAFSHRGTTTVGSQSSIDLSEVGEKQIVAVGLPEFKSDSKETGSVEVFEVLSGPSCGTNEASLRLSLTTGSHGSEMRWSLTDRSGTVRNKGGPYGDMSPFISLVEEMCIPKNDCSIFTVFDAAGNGIDSPGGYALFMDGVEVSRNGDFEFFETKYVTGDCSCQEGEGLFRFFFRVDVPFHNVQWVIMDKFGAPLSSGGPYNHDDANEEVQPDGFFLVVLEEKCIPIGEFPTLFMVPVPAESPADSSLGWCALPTPTHSEMECEVSFDSAQLLSQVIKHGDSIPQFCTIVVPLGDRDAPECDPTERVLSLELTSKGYDQPVETTVELIDYTSNETLQNAGSWELTDHASKKTLLNGGPYGLYSFANPSDRTFAVKTCLAPYSCFMLSLANFETSKVTFGDKVLNMTGDHFLFGDNCERVGD